MKQIVIFALLMSFISMNNTQLVNADPLLENLSISGDHIIMEINTKTNIIYASTFNHPYQIVAIDGKTNQVIESIPLSGAYDMAIDSSLNKIYVAHHSSNGSQISVIDGATNKIIGSILDLPDTVYLAVDQNSHKVYAKQTHGFNFSPDTSIFIIDGNTNSLSRTVKIELSPGAISFDNNMLYVLDYNNTKQIAAFDSNLEKKDVFFYSRFTNENCS